MVTKRNLKYSKKEYVLSKTNKTNKKMVYYSLSTKQAINEEAVQHREGNNINNNIVQRRKKIVRM